MNWLVGKAANMRICLNCSQMDTQTCATIQRTRILKLGTIYSLHMILLWIEVSD